jgi:hypothetical protein
MAELAGPLRFWPHNPGDPGPEIYSILIEALDEERQLAVAAALINSHIAIHEAQIAGLKQIHAVIGAKSR